MKTEEKLKICAEALKELVNPAGAYDMDQLTHARNTISETARIAREALDNIGEEYNK